jgi:hypothetical protein|uniref:Putative replication protein n=1 Tax=Paracoccus marcusii TaxID=59779 RepID=R4QQH8_9RHOB|nr:putative replication protein [Paracoccus marcusii]
MSTFEVAKVSGPTPKNCSFEGQVAGLLPAVAPQAAFKREVQVVRIGTGRECAYVLNDRVAWADKRDNLRLSRFSAEIVADAEDQSEHTLSSSSCCFSLGIVFCVIGW